MKDSGRRSVRVDQKGRGDFSTIGGAVAAIEREAAGGAKAEGERAVILIEPGLYREKLFIDTPCVELRGLGAGAESTVIVWGDYAKLALPDGRAMRTFNTATLFAGADHFRAENLTIENDAGIGEIVGQAVAAYVDADDVVFSRCRLVGHQDTLFTGPLPPSPIEGADFGGPRDSGPGRLSKKAPGSPAVGRQRYEGCFISGDIDFIFGSAEAIFRDCEIRSRDIGLPVNGWISAASTPCRSEASTPCRSEAEAALGDWLNPGPRPWIRPDEAELLRSLSLASGASLPPVGHFFLDCRLTCEPGTAEGSVYLGRPWRDWARTIYARCEMASHIASAGWDDWNKAAARERATYIEYRCSGPGSRPRERASWTIAV